MVKKKGPTPVVLAETNVALENPYLNVVEYVIKRHIGNKISIIQSLDLPVESKQAQYVADVTEFVNSLIESELFLLNLNSNDVIKLWKEIRAKSNNNVLSFILYTTSKLRFHFREDYANVIKYLTEAFTYTYKIEDYDSTPSDKYDNAMQMSDTEFKHKPYHREKIKSLFENNPWLVTITMITMIDPIL